MAITDLFTRKEQPKGDNFDASKDQFVTVKQACEILKVSDETLRRWEKLGRITPYFQTPPEQRIRAIDYRGKRYRLSDINKLMMPGETN